MLGLGVVSMGRNINAGDAVGTTQDVTQGVMPNDPTNSLTDHVEFPVIVSNVRGRLYDGLVCLVRTESGRTYETDATEAQIRERIALKQCPHCTRSLAHRRDYEAGQLCMRCDVDDAPEDFLDA